MCKDYFPNPEIFNSCVNFYTTQIQKMEDMLKQQHPPPAPKKPEEDPCAAYIADPVVYSHCKQQA